MCYYAPLHDGASSFMAFAEFRNYRIGQEEVSA